MASSERTSPEASSAGVPEPAELCWLDAADVQITRDARGALTLRTGGREFPDVQTYKAFALTDAHRFVAFRDRDGVEIGILRDPAAIAEPGRSLLWEHLQRQYFIPAIERIDRIREVWSDQVWTVQTDRGPREFTIQNRESIRFVNEGSLLLIDTDGSRYIIRNRLALDAASRGWIDRFVW